MRKVVSLEFFSSPIYKVKSVEEKVKYLEEGLKILGVLCEKSVEVNELLTSDVKTFDNSLKLLMSLEELLNIDLETLKVFRDRCLGSTPSYRRRVSRFLDILEVALGTIEKQTFCFIPFTTEELTALNKLLSESSGNLSSFIYHQFEFKDIDNDEPIEEINDVLDYFITKQKVDDAWIKNLAKYLDSVIKSFKPSLGAFERYPELLEPFSELVGSDLYDCFNIDIKTIKDIVDGKIDIQEFSEKLEEMLRDESEE